MKVSIFLYLILIFIFVGCKKKNKITSYEEVEKIEKFLILKRNWELTGNIGKRKNNIINVVGVILKYKGKNILVADFGEYKGEEVRLYKNILINWENMCIKADEAVINLKEESIICKGKVKLEEKRMRLDTNFLFIDLNKGVLKSMEDVKIKIG